MTTRAEAWLDKHWDEACEAFMKEEKARILDMLEQGDTPEQIIRSYKQYETDCVAVPRACVEAIVEDLQDENKQRKDEGA